MARFILQGSALAVAARLVAVGAGFAVQVLLARLLPPAELGAYFLIQSVVTVLSMLAQAGLGRPLTRELARLVGQEQMEGARDLLWLCLRLSIVPVAIVAALYALGAGQWIATALFSSPVMAGTSAAAAGWIAALAFQNLGAGAVRGLHRVGLAAFLGGALTNVLLVCAVAALFWTSGSSELLKIVWIAAAATWTNVAVCTLALGWSMRGVRSEPAVPARVILASALPLILTQFANAAINQADLWMVGALLSENEVALYGASKRMVRLVAIPMVAINLVVPPLLADLYARGELERLQRAMRGAATLAALPSLAVLLPLLLVGGPILGLVFGSFFADGGDLLRLLCVERLAYVWVGPCLMALVMTGHERDVLVVTLLAGAITVGATWLGGTLAGAVGVATAVALTGLLREAAFWLVARGRLGIRSDVDLLHLGAMREAAQRALRRRDGTNA